MAKPTKTIVDRELIEAPKLLDETGLTEVKLNRTANACASRAAAAAAPAAVRSKWRRRPPSKPPPCRSVVQAPGVVIADGWHNSAPEPGAKPFIEIGSRSKSAIRC